MRFRPSSPPWPAPPVLPLLLLGVELEGEHQQEHAEHQRIGADPHRQHDCADQRLNNEQDAENDRGDAAKCEPPPSVIEIER